MKLPTVTQLVTHRPSRPHSLTSILCDPVTTRHLSTFKPSAPIQKTHIRRYSSKCCSIDKMATSSKQGASGTPVYIQEVTPEITTFDYPFSRFGILPIGGRSIAIRMRDGRLWVVPSTPLDQPTKAKIDAMGEVAYLVAPDNVHHLFLKDFHAAYPAAKVVGTEGHEEKRPDVKFTGIYGRDPPTTQYGYESELVPQYFVTFANKDVAFLHKDSQTLITADLLFNLPCNQQYRNTPSGKATSWIPGVIWFSKLFNPYSSFHKTFLGGAGVASGLPGVANGGSKEERKKNFAEAASTVAKWDFRRIIMLHGDIIENHGQEAWRAAFSKYIDNEGNSRFKSA
ncbi:hypothetical protein PANT_22c00086 [Moesziomyces antarcticus T-34]|uniref:DUF4336 domain-containing protein n=1 Tax=Pseudozyma antarctica (strain T-34) TaxID=1151754 RepID=M9MFX8_PSEA3|nr:hypothetical protein PANT_22c00086 [Moesziomyces antarcticus T-34]